MTFRDKQDIESRLTGCKSAGKGQASRELAWLGSFVFVPVDP